MAICCFRLNDSHRFSVRRGNSHTWETEALLRVILRTHPRSEASLVRGSDLEVVVDFDRLSGELKAFEFNGTEFWIAFDGSVGGIDAGNGVRLPCSTARPIDFDALHGGGVAEANLQAQRIAPKTAAGIARSIQGAFTFWRCAHNPKPCTNARPIGLPAIQFEFDPMVSVSRILQEHVRILITEKGTAQILVHILVTVVVEVRKGHSMTLLKVAETTAGGDILKPLPVIVSEHPVGNERRKIWIAGAEVKIEPAIVVEIPEVGAHGVKHAIESDGFGNILERAIASIAVEFGAFAVVRLPEHVGDKVPEILDAITGDVEILEIGRAHV